MKNRPSKSNKERKGGGAKFRAGENGGVGRRNKIEKECLMKELIEEDDQEIQKYAKKLKLNKRKSRSLPKSFENDGLAYLLEICNPERSAIENSDLNDDEEYNASSNEEDGPNVESIYKSKRQAASKLEETSSISKKAKSVKRVRFTEELNDLRRKDVENFDDCETTEDCCRIKSNSGSDSEAVEESARLVQDIYGRLRDRRGNVVKEEVLMKTRPSENDSHEDKNTEMVQKNIRSIINRLGEANSFASAVKVGEFYSNFGRNAVKHLLTESIFQSILRPERVPNRLILEQCLLLAFVHSKVSSEITAYFVEKLSTKLIGADKQENFVEIEQDKVLVNVSLLFAYLYLLKVIQSKLIFDILKVYARQINEITVEWILTILQSVGSTLRKDNPLELKLFIDDVSVRSTSVDADASAGSRIKFLLETLRSIKNNNFSKVANCDLEMNDHFVKLLRSAFSGKALESPLPMNLTDLWSAEEKGRWWIVGSAVIVSRINDESTSISESGHNSGECRQNDRMLFNDKLLKLAKKNRMNTDIRRNVFCLMMSSEDYLDAFEKLTKSSFNAQQEREIIYIALNCCLKEKSYNPFYAYLIQKFCIYQPRFVLTTQFAIWDSIKSLKTKSESAINNLALCLSHLISNKTLSLSVIKVIDFGFMDTSIRSLSNRVFKNLLLQVDDETLKAIFTNCLHQKKNDAFLEGVKAFLRYHFLKRVKVDDEHQLKVIQRKISLIDNVLYFQGNDSLL